MIEYIGCLLCILSLAYMLYLSSQFASIVMLEYVVIGLNLIIRMPLLC